MRYLFSSLCVLAFPLAAMAQSYSNAPMLVVTPETLAATPTPPATAIAALAPSAAAPAVPAPAASPAATPAPAAASVPASAWPHDTVPIFMTSCTKLKVEMVDPCSCIITKVVTQFTHEEFLKMDASGTLATDPKMQQIREQCVDSALMDKKRPANRRAE